MPIYRTKDRDEVLKDALQRVRKSTPLTAVGAGSIVRALVDSMAQEVENLNSVIDFAFSNTMISQAQGHALDMMGKLHGVERKRLSNAAAQIQVTGLFYFYLEEAHTSDIVIPAGTKVSTPETGYNNRSWTFQTVNPVTIRPGRLRVFARIEPSDFSSAVTVGENRLTQHGFSDAPEGVTVKCTNPKEIPAIEAHESDDAYRARIIKAVRTSGGGTSDAVRFKALSVTGVRDVRVKDARYGLGTVNVVVVPEDYSQSQQIIDDVRTKVEEVKPAGVRAIYTLPDFVKFSMVANVLIKPEFSSSSGQIVQRVRKGAENYLNSLLPGDKLVYSSLVHAMMDASPEAIEDVVLTSLTVGGSEILRQNYTPSSTEQIVPGSFQISSAVAATN